MSLNPHFDPLATHPSCFLNLNATWPLAVQVGLAAVQLAVGHGCRVLGTAGSQQGLDLVRAQGAHAVFNHREAGYIDKIKVRAACPSQIRTQPSRKGSRPHLCLCAVVTVDAHTPLSLERFAGICWGRRSQHDRRVRRGREYER